MTGKKKSKSEFLGETKGLEGQIFDCGNGMDKKCMTSKEKLLEYVGIKLTASEKLSLEKGKRCLVGVKTPADISKEDYDFFLKTFAINMSFPGMGTE